MAPVCTLALAWQTFADAPIVAAANRDEALDRPSSPPLVRPDGLAPGMRSFQSSTQAPSQARSGDPTDVPTVLAPRDDRSGGSWIGLNDRGVFVTITNRWLANETTGDGQSESEMRGNRSRGLLVADCLAAQSATAAAKYVENEVDRRQYDGFNLVIADASSAHILTWDGQLTVNTLTSGIHVVVNVGADGVYEIPEFRHEIAESQARNADTLRARLQPEPGSSPDQWLDAAGTALGNHDAGLCHHGEDFGTRSMSLVRIGVDGDVLYKYADGPPCKTPAKPLETSFTATISRNDRSIY